MYIFLIAQKVFLFIKISHCMFAVFYNFYNQINFNENLCFSTLVFAFDIHALEKQKHLLKEIANKKI